ncbi:lysylphosphatidylglycerol synthetase family protein [Marinobacter maroccanus]|uniref:Lysylphosphatidylglycerol synthetase family protein n=1 Tax=Marinobacter maroccanus TaxID=2055143 RepID=A0A2S5ZBB5_9GAMM|nr:lysylphosphatidylglycerol synthase transmembrane domain-containing protein [Marinobacter maroccanus]PPI84685.1 lysylphosphatidylglycerol synthetase family protein [Marinobacter maroccanus]
MTELRQRRLRLAARWLFTVLIIGFVIRSVDASALFDELARVSLYVLLPALALTVFQVALSAWRWRYTVERLGLPLAYPVAVREYYLATFLNQVLPGGVLGDVNRAWRHGSGAGERLSAVHGVAIERLSGQLVLGLVVALSVSWLVSSGHLTFVSRGGGQWLVIIAVVVILGTWLVLRTAIASYLKRLRHDLYLSLLNCTVLPVQLGSSLLVLASYLGVFLCLAWGAGYLGGVESVAVIAGLGSILLLSMVIPLTVAGWGIREGAAAVLWPMVGLPAEQGVALSVGYGALVLVSSLPGVVFLFGGKPAKG